MATAAALPATPQVVGAYLAACGEGYAMSTLRRRVAAIARASGALSAPLDTRHPHIRETLRGIGVEYGAPARQAAALTTDEIRRLIAGCGEDLTGRRDRALLLIGFAAALRRSELVALEVADLTAVRGGLKLLIGRSKTDATHEGAFVVLARGQAAETCPVRAVQAWLTAASITHGPIFGVPSQAHTFARFRGLSYQRSVGSRISKVGCGFRVTEPTGVTSRPRRTRPQR